MGVISPAFSSSSEETDHVSGCWVMNNTSFCCDEAAGRRVSPLQHDPGPRLADWPQYGEYIISIRVVIWLWWVQKKLTS
jgi:hypothetical protein